jgi:hypothetical protein
MFMRMLAFTLLLTALGCLAQQPAPPAAGSAAITVPAGTKIPLRLTSPLGTKTAQAGDAVHAEAAFPVTAGNTVAIPPGTYVEGVIDEVTPRGRHAGFAMHFTRMVFHQRLHRGVVRRHRGHPGLLGAHRRSRQPRPLAGSYAMAGGMALQTIGTTQPPTVSQPSLPGTQQGFDHWN